MNDVRQMDSEELFKRFAPFVARFLLRMGVRDTDLDDLLQDVFLVAHRNGGYRPGAASPATYLANIAIHATAAYRRKLKSRQRVEPNSIVIERASGHERDPLQNLLHQIDVACVKEALDTLDPKRRALFVLIEIEGESCVSVSAGLQIPLNTVYSRLRTARERFCKAARYQVRKSEQTNLSSFPECVP
ncbi:MAG: RNA polymerase sigma factor [Deltaproteobacteria bacterium]|nr:RNA polymerase sigma factor [Deltaproteobacteria bacterium]